MYPQRVHALLMLAHIAKADQQRGTDRGEFLHDMVHHIVVGEQDAVEWAFQRCWDILVEEYKWSDEGINSLAPAPPKEESRG